MEKNKNTKCDANVWENILQLEFLWAPSLALGPGTTYRLYPLSVALGPSGKTERAARDIQLATASRLRMPVTVDVGDRSADVWEP